MAGEALGRLCRGGGWTYGALWCNDCGDPRLLVLEESYCEEQSEKILEKTVKQVHVIGQGTIGEVVISRRHRWINFDTIGMESSEICSNVNPDIFQGSVEWQEQILAGIKTVAVIPLLSLGVLQFGSTQEIRESSNFIAQAQYLLWQFRIRFKNNVSSYERRQDNHSSSLCSSPASGLLFLESQIGSRSQKNSQKSHGFSKPISTSSGSSNGHVNLFYGTPSSSSTSYQVIDQQAASTKAGILLPSIDRELHSNCKCSSNFFATSLESSMRAKHDDSFSPAMAIPGVFNMIPTTLHSSIPCSNEFHCLNKNSVFSHSKVGSKPIVDNIMSFNNSEPCPSVTEKLLEFQHCSSAPVSICDISASKYSSKVFPFTMGLPENFLTSEDRNPENSNLVHSNTKFTDHQIHNHLRNIPIHLCHQTNGQLNNVSVPSKYSFPDVPIASSDMAENASIACSVIAALPNTATEGPAVCVASSLNRGSDWDVINKSYACNQLVSEQDLFDGMELDLIPIISRQECWDDMVLPAFGNGCIDFSTGLSNCISELEMSSVVGSGKGLFSDSSSFEQLLDAVVAGNANVSTGCNSVGTKISVIGQDSRRHISTTKTYTDAQIPATSLSKCDTEKMMQASLSDRHPNCHVHRWIGGTCVNAEGSALHQPKKLEESAIVRKRARPGESTRPRPKDRQQIQDRVKELREIVPNGAKCSIDSLLDRTIKYMLFLQSVTKYVDKLKQADVPKLIGEESGVVLKDNTNGGVGGATWAYEVAGQTMVCPILVEDVYPLGQMLVEILCEGRGFFLEIADVVRSFGLTILKGDMEIRERKVWARFLVEVIDRSLVSFHHNGHIFQSRKMISLLSQANRDVTRMDIFLSLVRFLQQTSSFRTSEFGTTAISTGIKSLTVCQQQSPASIPIRLVDKFH